MRVMPCEHHMRGVAVSGARAVSRLDSLPAQVRPGEQRIGDRLVERGGVKSVPPAPRSARFDLAAVERHAADPWAPSSRARCNTCSKKPRNAWQMPRPKVGDRPEVRLVAGRQHTECDVFDQPPLDAPRRKDTDAVGVTTTFVNMTG